MFNNVSLIGNLGGDPEIRTFESGAQRSQFTLYVNERYKKDDELQERVHRFSIEVWGTTAKYVAQYLRKGSRVAVSGSLAEQIWKEGEQNRSRVIVKAQRVENLTPKTSDDNQSMENTALAASAA